ncbi:S8 family peptidase [Cyclobacteriaceae bacterium]|nr:S8 family peptidase [Cyclobacteriaceae bacterium]
MTLLKKVALPLALTLSLSGIAQEQPKTANWQNGKTLGMNTDKAYKKYFSEKKSKTVIVAVLDSGVDIEHEDLQGAIWVNEDEIPDNGIDDDNNGYIDDVHGWSFLGNDKGENVEFDNLEMARIYGKLKPKYDTLLRGEIPKNELKDYDLYIEVKDKINEKKETYTEKLAELKKTYDKIEASKKFVESNYGKNVTMEELSKAKFNSEREQTHIVIYMLILKAPEAIEQITEAYEYYQEYLDYYINPDYNSRTIVGDDPEDFTQTSYGNNDVEGPDARHGTHVSGIIAAIRNNGKGINGVADNVKIMSVRTVPDGDERDKDVALAIRYAVDNGAQVINMSFGKGYSPNAKEVYEAIKYAESKGVLLIHAAGNDAENVDKVPNFPSNHYEFQTQDFTNYLTIGASTNNKKMIPASFSNYGQKYVDVFAPGYKIYATIPDNKYENLQGTSMAAPMVTGVAALLKSYYPELTMLEIKEIILLTSTDLKSKKVIMPGTEEQKVVFGELSTTGGVVNVLEAAKLCEEKVLAKKN